MNMIRAQIERAIVGQYANHIDDGSACENTHEENYYCSQLGDANIL